ncbi:MAG: hypothetical protein M3P96_00345 [Actinomycetota bacterium]|nr:hypothetical protein [Actinomycetota bacterium]
MIADAHPFHTRQLASLQLTPYGLRRGLAEGRIRRVIRGGYVASAIPDSRAVRAATLALIVEGRGVVCRTTALWLYGLDGLGPGEHRLPPYAEVVVAEGRTAVRRQGCRGYVAQLRPEAPGNCLINATSARSPREVRDQLRGGQALVMR